MLDGYVDVKNDYVSGPYLRYYPYPIMADDDDGAEVTMIVLSSCSCLPFYR